MLTWNLYHGRSTPPAGRELLAEFAAALAGWDWDVALLQEVPPWWPPALPGEARVAPTSRNALAPLRRTLARRWPDVVKSNGGGANAILVRRAPIHEHRVRRLRRWPERRVVHAVRLASGAWVANVHCQPGARRDVAAAAAALLEWAGPAPAVLGGDLNVRPPLVPEGFAWAGGHDIDHVLCRGGLAPSGPAETLDAGPLSDHAPVVVALEGTRAG